MLKNDIWKREQEIDTLRIAVLFCLVEKPFQLEDNYQDNLAMIAFEQSLVCTVSISTSTSLFDTDHTSAEAGWLQL